MRFSTRFCLGLAAALCLSAIAAGSAFAGSREDDLYARQKPASVTLPDSGTIAPLLMADSHPTVEVSINGRVYHFQIETGAWFNTVSARVVDDLGLRPDREGVVAIDGLRMGTASFGTFRAEVMEHAPGDSDGQLGLPAFADLLLTVDFPNRQVKLEKGALPAANGRDVLALTSVGPLWGVPVNVGGQSFTGFIDTQSGDGIAMAPQFARKVAFTTKPVATGDAHGPAIGAVQVTTARLSGDFAFGGYTFKQPMVASFPLEIRFPNFGVMMGPPLLSKFALTLDQKDKRVRFERTGDAVIPPPPPMVRMGMVTEPGDHGSMRIIAVQPGGGAAASGLRAGDEIVTIDGAAADTLTPGALATTKLAGMHVHLRRGASERDVEVKPAVIIP
ncbi:MAG TPA: hypothetical protein VG407_10390 [Caulobacteraceae bacterium]|jgi:hypothetical protein|nr:hypothetical protein [Caulobacteraceae bacterium]